MSYAVLEIPGFALHARLRLEPAGTRPAAIYTGAGRKAVVTEVCEAGRRRGLREGMSAVQALGLCPELRLWPRLEAAEAEAMALLLARAWSLSPRVEASAPGRCTAALAGRDEAGVRRDLAVLLRELPAQGLPLRAGVGPTPGVARFAAHLAEPECWVTEATSFLAPLPVHLLELTAGEAALFDSLGLRTLGELARMPQAALAQRLGERGARLWMQAAGRDQRPLVTATPPTRHAVSHDFEQAAETLEPLLFLLRRYVERLGAELEQAGLVAERLSLGLRLEDETRCERDFRLPQATARTEALFAVLEQYLGGLHTDAAVAGFDLELHPAEAANRQEGLFEASLRDPQQFYDTLARVAAVLGAERIGAPVRLDSHRPDAAGTGKPAAVIPEYRPPPGPGAAGPLLRRFRPAAAATVELTGAAPAYVFCAAARVAGAVRAARGPWRSGGGWWDAAEAWEQEAWDVQLDEGGLYRLTERSGGWFLEGVYD